MTPKGWRIAGIVIGIAASLLLAIVISSSRWLRYIPFHESEVGYLTVSAAVFVGGLALTAAWVSRSRNRLRREGRCLDCGYDLRGITSDKCPECGKERPV